ncbi:MAG: hypothetical protein RMK18_08120 [Armatimonadota bacterium]|nr:hypothetical protein [Armatimonadota bacterium]MCX7776737.1 hypothetical protein [Armatimonadota bacterium]MDW8025806.1 hypothetical protein [Armatimonadota bacterium]
MDAEFVLEGEVTAEPKKPNERKNPMGQFVVRHETKWSAVENAITLSLYGSLRTMLQLEGQATAQPKKMGRKIGNPVGLPSM